MFLFVYLPIGLYFIKNYVGCMNHICLWKRYPWDTLTSVICLVCLIVVHSLDLLQSSHLLYFQTLNHSLIFSIVVNFFQFLLYLIITYSVFCKIFLINFDINWNNLVSNKEWKKLIDYNLKNDENFQRQFYIAKKSTCGNRKWFHYVALAILLPMFIICYPTMIFAKFS